MASIEDVDLTAIIRSELYKVVAEYADKTQRRGVTFYDVFKRVIQYLKEKNTLKGNFTSSGSGTYDPHGFPNFGIEPEIATLIRREFWELFLQRIIAPAPMTAGAPRETYAFFSHDVFVVTPYGMSVLAEFPNRIQVHDPTGYLANFTAAVPAPDPVLIRYLTEAVHTFRDGHMLASVVLLASASDVLLDLVAKNVKRVQGGNWYNQTYRPNSNIQDRFRELLQKLRSDFNAELDHISVKDKLNTLVPAIFHEIRTARNDIAHPTGRDFTWNEVNGFLHLFVGYYLCFNQINGVLNAKPDAP